MLPVPFPKWQRLRKGDADRDRWAFLSRTSNERELGFFGFEVCRHRRLQNNAAIAIE